VRQPRQRRRPAPGTNAADRFAGGGPWRIWDPQLKLWTKLVATDRADLIDGALVDAIAVTEFASPAPANCAVWTGSTPKGVAPPPIGALGGTCQGWTTSVVGATGLAGRCDATDAAWTAAGPRECSEKLSIYCLQLPGTNPVIGPPTDLGGDEPDAGGDADPGAD
jgi:hypothetical protein